MRAAVYLRVSTKDGRQDTENQRAQLLDYVKSQPDWTLYKVYKDEVSGKTDERKAFQQMLSDAKARKFDVLAFWALDRLSREGALATLKHLELLNSLQIKFVSYCENYLNTCGIFTDVIISMLATLAKQERIRLSERTIAGLERSRKSGRPGPNGYLGQGRPRKGFDMKKARMLRDERHYSYQKIADELGVSKTLVRQHLTDNYPYPPNPLRSS